MFEGLALKETVTTDIFQKIVNTVAPDPKTNFNKTLHKYFYNRSRTD